MLGKTLHPDKNILQRKDESAGNVLGNISDTLTNSNFHIESVSKYVDMLSLARSTHELTDSFVKIII